MGEKSSQLPVPCPMVIINNAMVPVWHGVGSHDANCEGERHNTSGEPFCSGIDLWKGWRPHSSPNGQWAILSCNTCKKNERRKNAKFYPIASTTWRDRVQRGWKSTGQIGTTTFNDNMKGDDDNGEQWVQQVMVPYVLLGSKVTFRLGWPREK